jgi:hypothetical protein
LCAIMSNMGDLLPLLVLAIVGVTAAALFDCVTTDDRAIRQLPKGLWVLVILLLPGIGAVTWFASGRHSSATAAHLASGHPAGRGRVEAPLAAIPESPRPRTLAPDDDPEFLADLAARTAKMRDAHLDSRSSGGATMAGGADRTGEEERLRRWEADLRQREERLRQRGEPPVEE